MRKILFAKMSVALVLCAGFYPQLSQADVLVLNASQARSSGEMGIIEYLKQEKAQERALAKLEAAEKKLNSAIGSPESLATNPCGQILATEKRVRKLSQQYVKYAHLILNHFPDAFAYDPLAREELTTKVSVLEKYVLVDHTPLPKPGFVERHWSCSNTRNWIGTTTILLGVGAAVHAQRDKDGKLDYNGVKKVFEVIGFTKIVYEVTRRFRPFSSGIIDDVIDTIFGEEKVNSAQRAK